MKPIKKTKTGEAPPAVQAIDLGPGRAIFVRAPRRLDKAQLALALSSMGDEDPRWVAVHQLIDEELSAAMLDASSPDLTDARVRHAGGRVEALSMLKKRLYEERSAKIGGGT